MNIEKEVRYKINDDIVRLIQNNTNCVKASQKMIDLVMGYYGFDSLEKVGYICRIRSKNNKTVLECKKLCLDSTWIEESIKIDSIQQGYNLLSLMGYTPYLFIDRIREERETADFKIAIDFVSLLGTFVEFEAKNINDECIENKLNALRLKFGIEDKPQKLYGDIFKEKCVNDNDFKHEVSEMLKKIVTPLN